MDILLNDQQSKLVQDAINGEVSALYALAILKQNKAYTEKCIEAIEGSVEHELEKYDPKEVIELHGFRFERRKGGAVYNFKNVPLWNEKSTELKTLESNLKAAYKAYESGSTLQANSDGEEVVMPEVSYRKDSLIIKKS